MRIEYNLLKLNAHCNLVRLNALMLTRDFRFGILSLLPKAILVKKTSFWQLLVIQVPKASDFSLFFRKIGSRFGNKKQKQISVLIYFSKSRSLYGSSNRICTHHHPTTRPHSHLNEIAMQTGSDFLVIWCPWNHPRPPIPLTVFRFPSAEDF